MSKIDQVNTQIGQIEKSINESEDYLNDEEFKDFCDNAYCCISYLRVIKKRIKEE